MKSTLIKLITLLAILCNSILISAELKATNSLKFMVGDWKTEGTQVWSDNSIVKHRGIVECRLLEDDITIERTFWSSFENGFPLIGRALTIFDSEKENWSETWIPTTGNWDSGTSVCRMEGDEYIEIARGKDSKGVFTSKTRIYNIDTNSYEVGTDLYYDDYSISKNNWYIKFTRIKFEKDSSGVQKNFEFMLGEWVSEGEVEIAENEYTSHKGYVIGKKMNDSTIHRQIYGGLEKGYPLVGISTHTQSNLQMSKSQWIPSNSTPAPIAIGNWEGKEYVEEYVVDTKDGSLTLKTTFFDVSNSDYKVKTELMDGTDVAIRTIWTAHYKKTKL